MDFCQAKSDIGGHISDSQHIPSRDFAANVERVISDNKRTKRVVFHCSLSQIRGPKAARIYNEAKTLTGGGDEQDVYVLSGGFSQWQEKYGKDPSLTEDYDTDFWELQKQL